MNAKKFAVAAVIAAASVSAFAAELNEWDGKADATVSTLSRAQVQAEVVKARAEGLIATGDVEQAKIAALPSTLTRAQVRSEAVVAARQGHLTGDL